MLFSAFMKFSIFFSIIFIAAVGAVLFLHSNAPVLQANIATLSSEAKEAGFDAQKWKTVFQKSKDLPSVYPITKLKSVFLDVEQIFVEAEKIKTNISKLDSSKVQTQVIKDFFKNFNFIAKKLKNIESNINSIPNFLLNEKQKQERELILQKIQSISQYSEDIKILEKVFKSFLREESRILILLQNQNEPRPTGGFVGSFLVIDFAKDDITWEFSDIYNLDRQVPETVQLPAPEFFHDLSKTISLRDANFWPDFPTSAKQYLTFFKAAKQKVPDTVIAINLNVIREILKFTGPIDLDKWHVSLDSSNFDMVLSFLVESKIEGRFGVKTPVWAFARELFSKEMWSSIGVGPFPEISLNTFFVQKNILAFSKNTALQEFLEKWNLDGKVQARDEADNFIYFDFVSIGANKSEKFVWTKLWHDSHISPDGAVKNSLEIKRTHALKSGEISDSLKTKNWPQNVKDLLSEDVLWKLGAGQNRTVMRVFVPIEAKLLSQKNPSGEITETFSKDKKFKILQIPMFVSPGEQIKINLVYETKLNRGSHDWRPYFLELVGTPAREKTVFLETISTTKNGRFSAETFTIGRPQDLVDTDFRAVVEF